MPTIIDLIEARLNYARKDLGEVIGHLTQTDMPWAPADGVRTTAGQLVEIAGCELQLITILKGGAYVNDDEVRKQIGDHNNLARLKEFLATVREETLQYLRGLTPEELEAEVDIAGWSESLGLPRTPRSEILRGIAQHEAWHTGQLVSYLWAKGDNPYMW